MADGINNLQCDQFVREQVKCPTSITGWRPAEPHRNQLCFAFAIEKRLRRRCLAFLPVESLLEPSDDKTLSQVLDRLDSAMKRIGDFRVGPSGAIRIGFQQDLGSSNFLRRAFEFLDHFHASLTFFIRKSNHILLIHGNLLVSGRLSSTKSNEFAQPLFLDLKTH